MTQKRTFEYKADDSTYAINQRLLEMIPPGLYHGFDASLNTGTTLELNHNSTGKISYDVNEIATNKQGIIITPQGVAIKEDSIINLPIVLGDSKPRIDLIILQHRFREIEGGEPAVYLVVKGVSDDNPVAPTVSNSIRQIAIGELFIPASMGSLDEVGVVYTRLEKTDFAGIDDKLKKALNLSDLVSITLARQNLGLGNHVTHNYGNSGDKYGEENSVARGDHLVNYTAESKTKIDSVINGFKNNERSVILEGCKGPYTGSLFYYKEMTSGYVKILDIVYPVDNHIPDISESTIIPIWQIWDDNGINKARVVYVDELLEEHIPYISQSRVKEKKYVCIVSEGLIIRHEIGEFKGQISFDQYESIEGQYRINLDGATILISSVAGPGLGAYLSCLTNAYDITKGVKVLSIVPSGSAATYLMLFFYNLADGTPTTPCDFNLEFNILI